MIVVSREHLVAVWEDWSHPRDREDLILGINCMEGSIWSLLEIWSWIGALGGLGRLGTEFMCWTVRLATVHWRCIIVVNRSGIQWPYNSNNLSINEHSCPYNGDLLVIALRNIARYWAEVIVCNVHGREESALSSMEVHFLWLNMRIWRLFSANYEWSTVVAHPLFICPSECETVITHEDRFLYSIFVPQITYHGDCICSTHLGSL